MMLDSLARGVATTVTGGDIIWVGRRQVRYPSLPHRSMYGALCSKVGDTLNLAVERA